MSYEQVAQFTHTWGMVYMIGIFVIVLVYALWPSNKEKFDRAARQPLDEEK